MQFQQELAAALALLESTGIGRGKYAPPLYRFLWRVGARVPPPHFSGFGTNFAIGGVWFGFVWGALMWFIVWSSHSVSLPAAFAAVVLMGVFFGFCLAAYYLRGARKHGIPLWRNFRPSDELPQT